MNAFEIAEAVSTLAGEPFDPANFPFAFLEAFDNKETTIAKLRGGTSNGSDVPGAVLQRNNIHLAVCANGETSKMLEALRESAATKKLKAKFILATDGEVLEAEDLTSGEAIACEYKKTENHFGFFLPLAGITTVKQIHNNPVDIQATGRLNRLYIELLNENPDWGTEARRHDLNQFMARLIFCFFAEDTDIFHGDQLFTHTVEQMSDTRTGNTHEVIAEIFRAMDILLAREAHWPATIADLYDPETMPENLRQAHERNDEVLERIYIGRRFKNDAERLEKLFELYTKMTVAKPEAAPKPKGRKGKRAVADQDELLN